MIIVEGVDNTGKSTLVKELMEKIPELVYGGNSPGPGNGQEIFLRSMKNAGKREKTIPMIWDRYPYFSEEVYGKVLRGKSVLHGAREREILNRLRYHRPLVIYCWRNKGEILETFDEREQMDGVKENIPELIEAYERLWAKVRGWILLVRYNYEKDPLPIQIIREYLKTMRRWPIG